MRSIYFHRLLLDEQVADYSDYHDPTYQGLKVFLAKWTRTHKFVDADEFVERLRSNRDWDPRIVHLGADDGFASMPAAAELCTSFGVPLTVFVSAAVLEGYVPWFVQRVCAIAAAHRKIELAGEVFDASVTEQALALHQRIKQLVYAHPAQDQHAAALELLERLNLTVGAIPEKWRFMTPAELQRFDQAGGQTGGHGMHHVALRGLDHAAVQAEIFASKTRLEAVLGKSIAHFSYPEGIYDDGVVEQVKAAGYRSGFAVTPRPGDDAVYAIPRQFFGRDIEGYLAGLYRSSRPAYKRVSAFAKHLARRRRQG